MSKKKTIEIQKLFLFHEAMKREDQSKKTEFDFLTITKFTLYLVKYKDTTFQL